MRQISNTLGRNFTQLGKISAPHVFWSDFFLRRHAKMMGFTTRALFHASVGDALTSCFSAKRELANHIEKWQWSQI
jgi:hypothetical protein